MVVSKAMYLTAGINLAGSLVNYFYCGARENCGRALEFDLLQTDRIVASGIFITGALFFGFLGRNFAREERKLSKERINK